MVALGPPARLDCRRVMRTTMGWISKRAAVNTPTRCGETLTCGSEAAGWQMGGCPPKLHRKLALLTEGHSLGPTLRRCSHPGGSMGLAGTRVETVRPGSVAGGWD
jgi:hypothetical protein